MAKRGRKPRVAAGASTLEKLKREEHPDVKYFADIEKNDATEVFNKDPNKAYRFCSEAVIGLRRRQGYEVTDDPKITTAVPGGGVNWGSEGAQAKLANRDLVLMEMPKKRFDLRQQIKHEKKEEAQQNILRKTDESANNVNSQMGGILSSEDPFVQDLRGKK
jgi:hypothetical protein